MGKVFRTVQNWSAICDATICSSHGGCRNKLCVSKSSQII